MNTTSWVIGASPMQAAIPVSLLLFFVLSNGAGVKALANQSLEKRVNTLMRVVDEQQKQIRSLERLVTNRTLEQRGRGVTRAARDAPGFVVGMRFPYTF